MTARERQRKREIAQAIREGRAFRKTFPLAEEPVKLRSARLRPTKDFDEYMWREHGLRPPRKKRKTKARRSR